MTSTEVKLIPLKCANTRISGCGPGLRFSLYKYTILHSDMIPSSGSYRHRFKCKFCGNDNLCSKTQAIFHVRLNHLKKMGKDIKNDIIERDFLEATRLLMLNSEENKLAVDLGMYKLDIADRGVLIELISEDLDLLNDMMTCSSMIMIEECVNNSKTNLITTIEDFEKKVENACDKYLGTPKEMIL